MPVYGIPGSKVFIDNNPPPTLDTIDSYFLKHFMTLLSEDNMTITSVISYVKETGFTDTILMVNVINECYGVYRSELNKYQEAHKDKG